MDELQVLKALLRSDLSAFIEKTFHTIVPGEQYHRNWHIDAIAHALDQCMKGEIKRLIITMPPRCLKSISASVAFPAYILGKDPTRRIICSSYGQDLATKHGNDMRAVMDSTWYQSIFPETRPNKVGNTQTEYRTTQMGGRISTSVGGGLTGRGGNVIIVDDPHKADEVTSDTKREQVINWFRNTLVTRLDDKENGIIIVIQQRLHEEDLAGHLCALGGWTHLNLTAIAEEPESIPIGKDKVKMREIGDLLHPVLYSQSVLDDLKVQMGSYLFAAQYQQRPAPQEGGFVKWNWFQMFKNMPQKLKGDKVVQSWDTATTVNKASDYSVCTTWLCSKNHYYLIDVYRHRLDFPSLKAQVIKLATRWPVDLILVESSSIGIPLIQDLRRQTPLNIYPIKPLLDKATRLFAETAAIEAGRVHVYEKAAWLADFQREMTLFPYSKHDDQIDSVSQFLYYTRTEMIRIPQLEAIITVVGGDIDLPF